MKTRTWIILPLLGTFLAIAAGALIGAEIKPAGDAPEPLTPEESAKLVRLPEGLRLELVAAEPLLADPTCVAWDERGRMFVSELHGYNLEGHLDVQELNKTGVLDKQIRRIPAEPWAIEQARDNTYGTIKLLTDNDGDGRMEKADVWADDLPPCYGMVAARGGLIVVCGTEILYLADGDGDGRAEIRQTLFSGFRFRVVERAINNPRWGADNWIYVSAGFERATISGPKLAGEVHLGHTEFRIRPDGTALEPVTGANGTFGLALTDFGDRFLTSTNDHARYAVPLPHRYLLRNPYVATPSTVANAAGYYQIYPLSRPHPWRLKRSRNPAWVRFYGARETTAGYFTSLCGQMVYRAQLLPAEYHGHYFVCEPSQNIVHRSIIERDGAGFKVHRAEAERRSEFLASADKWFRPINLLTGPQGAIYIVDMYREIIEDYSAIPRYLQQQYGLIEGHRRGRIWRVVPEGKPPAPLPELATAAPQELVEQIASANAWLRLTAQRLLVERRDQSVVPALRRLVRRGNTPQARLHALYTLDGLQALSGDDVLHALGDSSYALRVHALRLADPLLDSDGPLLRKVLAMIDDPDAGVRLQLAMTLGETKDPRAAEALCRLAARHGRQRWMGPAILSSAMENAHGILDALLGQRQPSQGTRALLKPLASTIGARRDESQMTRALSRIAAAEPELQGECLSGLVEGLQRGKGKLLASAAGRAAVGKLVESKSRQVRALALKVAGLVKLDEAPELLAAFANAGKRALAPDVPLEERREAVALLAAAPYSMLGPAARRLLDVRQAPELQLAAVEALSASDDERVGAVLLDGWKGYSPQVRSDVLDAVFARQNRLPALLGAIESKTVPPRALASFRRDQLMRNTDRAIASRAQRLLGDLAPEGNRQELLDRYAKALAGPRDVKQGRKIYVEHCSTCHRLRDEGYQVGPDLSGARDRADETMLLDLLDPSGQISAGYGSYIVLTEAGKIFTGVLASESATSITLRSDRETTATILRKNIDTMEASELSLMPEDFHKQVGPKDVADLIGYLRDVLGPVARGRILFDDEAEFPGLLSSGEGTAGLIGDDCFSGDAALLVTPPQRYAERIAGWSFPIRENPGEDQYRYLRLAWKARGDGVMIELAAGGAWPAAEEPGRRYYSGKNTTAWQATRISAAPPREWTEVTVDLWQDFGQFTLTGIAPTAMGGEALFDRIELLRSIGP